VVRLTIINMAMAILDTIRDDIIMVISLRVFRLGGRAIFAAFMVIHITDIIGDVNRVPFINIILREFIFSYIILVNINKHDDVSACVSIIINLAHKPNFELDISPIIINPMCLTDE